MIVPRWLFALYGAGLAIALVGGALLFSFILRTAHTNADFICTFGSALNERLLKQESYETRGAFRKRVQLTRHFVHELNRIQDCDPPAVIRIAPGSKDILTRSKKRDVPQADERPDSRNGNAAPQQGGGGNSSSAPPSSQPTPPPPGGGGNGGGSPPSNPPNPPANPPGLLDQPRDTVNGITCNRRPVSLCL